MKIASIILACLLYIAPPLQAMPMLSADGSLLTGVIVQGEAYDVNFGDAILGDIYPSSVVGGADWFSFANAMKQGILNALLLLPDSLVGGDINGCEAGAVIGPFEVGCIILIPDLLFLSTGTPNFGSSSDVVIGSNWKHLHPSTNGWTQGERRI
ncbi:MAG: hypothetical protein R3E64_05940 [Halioglobus sp.]